MALLFSLFMALVKVAALLYIFVTITTFLVVLLVGYVLLWPFSLKLLMYLIYFLQENILLQLCFVLTQLAPNMKFIWTGDIPPPGESSLVVPNHQNIDWMPLYLLALGQGVLGGVRTVVKKSFQYVPGFGWGMWGCYWPFISRDFKKDEIYLRNLFGIYKKLKFPISLWLFPEGTRMTSEKLKSSQNYAREKGYPVFDHVLLPRPKGFFVTLMSLKDVVSHVYNVTIGYKGWKSPPGLVSMIVMDPSKHYEVHVDLKRIPIGEMPTEEEKSKEWLLTTFAEKDKLMARFKSEGKFQEQGKERPLKGNPYLWAFAKGVAILSVTWSSCYLLLSTFY